MEIWRKTQKNSEQNNDEKQLVEVFFVSKQNCDFSLGGALLEKGVKLLFLKVKNKQNYKL